MAFKKYFQIDANGKVLCDLVTSIPPEDTPEGSWIEASHGNPDAAGMPVDRVRYCSVNGVQCKKQVRLSIGSMTFVADGVQKNAIGIRDIDDPTKAVRIMVNDDEYFVKQHEDLMLVTDVPGDFYVWVDDAMYYSSPTEVIIHAKDPAELDSEEEEQQP